MMKLKICSIFFQQLLPILLIAQNLGIGTTSPLNKLHVQGGVSFTATYKSTNSAPKPAQHYTMINASTLAVTSSDSIARIYDPGGAAGNYIPNLSAEAEIHSGGSFLTITIEQAGLGAGDSLIIHDGLHAGTPVIYKLSYNNVNSPVSINTSTAFAFIRFKSNADASVGSGFSLVIKRNYNDASQTDADGFGGNGIIFYPSKGAIKGGRLSQIPVSNFSVALGSYTAATGLYSFAMGAGTLASGSGSFAIGNGTTASNTATFASGANSTASGPYSTAMGFDTEASGNYSTAFGYRSKATNYYSTVMGEGNQAIGWASTAAGHYNIAKSSSSFVIGRYSDTVSTENEVDWQPTDRVFVIGDGASLGARSSCFYIQKNGNGWMQGTLTQASDARLKKNIVPLKKVMPRLLSLSGYSYYWKDENNLPGLQAGFIAQEVQQQMPELVTTNAEGQLAVNYSGIIPYLLEGIKEQQAEIDDLKNELKRIKEMLYQLTNDKYNSSSVK